jgi:ketosteroid isomerase-like protein
MTPDEDRIAELYAAINARDVDATVSCYAPHARFADGLEGGMLEGLHAIRAHFVHLFETIRVELSVIDFVREPDGRLRTRLHVDTRGPGGGLWQDGTVIVWYRLERGLIVEQDVDDSGRDGNTP